MVILLKQMELVKHNLNQWVKEINNLNKLENIKIKHSIDIKDKTVIFNFLVINRKKVWTRGTSNQTKDNYFVPYFDWDNLRESYVKQQALILQEQFDLGDLLIFKSSEKSYQGVGFVKLSLYQFQKVLQHSSCDFAFINFPKFLPYAKYYVLRQFSKGNVPKPKLLYILKRKTNKQQSFAHWKYFKLLYPESKINKPKNSDNLGDLTIVDYPTGTNI